MSYNFIIYSFEIAKCISEDSYGLIFGVNTFISLLLQTILTLTVVTGNLNLHIRSQVRPEVKDVA